MRALVASALLLLALGSALQAEAASKRRPAVRHAAAARAPMRGDAPARGAGRGPSPEVAPVPVRDALRPGSSFGGVERIELPLEKP